MFWRNLLKVLAYWTKVVVLTLVITWTLLFMIVGLA